MPDMDTAADKLIDLVRSLGLIRPRDLEPIGIPRISLTRAVRRGQLERVGRGLYGLPGRQVSAHGVLAEVARRVPKGVVCLLSALRFHGLTTQAGSAQGPEFSVRSCLHRACPGPDDPDRRVPSCHRQTA